MVLLFSPHIIFMALICQERKRLTKQIKRLFYFNLLYGTLRT